LSISDRARSFNPLGSLSLGGGREVGKVFGGKVAGVVSVVVRVAFKEGVPGFFGFGGVE
jgi:hypothetical protein